MLVSYNWLKQYVSLPASVTPEKVAHQLTMSTVEVEGVKKTGADLEKIVVGKILSAEKHPNADKLKVCQVDVGSEKLQIVCGGTNLREGMLVAAALPGAKIRWHGEGDLVELQPTTIRGIKSFGMICASAEIGLGGMFPSKEEKEILDLSIVILIRQLAEKDLPRMRDSGTSPEILRRFASQNDKLIGKPIAKVLHLDDAIFEIDNKSLSNRPDLWGHYGLAREVAALFKTKLAKINPAKVNPPAGGKGIKVSVQVKDKNLCPHYMAVAMEGIKIAPSPAWLQEHLRAIGLHPINNIVDITNYIMNDLGQPLHAFDFEKIKSVEVKSQKSKVKSKEIIVRRAEENEWFATLDGQEYRLTKEILVIADEEKPVALAGVIGGLNSGIDEQTKTIIFESANFDAASIRKTSTKLGLRTDSSARFEKSLDPNLCDLALRQAVALTLKLCPGAKVASPVADEKSFKLNQGPIELSWKFLEKKIGIALSQGEVIAILRRLGFEIKKKAGGLAVKIPTWRATKDISLPEDLVEEIIRIYGYDKIKSQLPSFPIIPPQENKLRNLERQAREILSQGLGFSEVYNYSFISLSQIKNLGSDEKKYLELDNPLSKEQPFLRRCLLSGLLSNLEKNIEFFPEVKIFEIGKTFWQEEKGELAGANKQEFLPKQDTWLTLVYASKNQKAPFWQARQAFEALKTKLGAPLELAPSSSLKNWQHPARAGAIKAAGKEIGAVYEIHPQILEKHNLEVRVGVLEINLSELVKFVGQKTKIEPLPEFPEIERDLALLVDKGVAQAKTVAEILKIDQLIKKAELFDFYAGDKIEKGKKSLAYHLTFSDPSRTLTAKEVDEVQEKLVKQLADKFGAQLRA